MKLTIDKKQELQRKAAILKQYEDYSYQAAFFLLQNEALAEQAAMNALKELLQHASFFLQPRHIQKQTAKQVVMKHSLLTKANASVLIHM